MLSQVFVSLPGSLLVNVNGLLLWVGFVHDGRDLSQAHFVEVLLEEMRLELNPCLALSLVKLDFCTYRLLATLGRNLT